MSEENPSRIRPVVHEVPKAPTVAPPPITNPSTNPTSQKNYKQIFLFLVIFLIIITFITGGLYVYFSGNHAKVAPSPTPSSMINHTPAPTPSPSPTSEPTPDLTQIKINILNGSGKIGEAGKVGDLLKSQGFESLTLGNAARFDYQETIIQATAATSSKVITIIKEALAPSYKITIGDPLAQSSKFDLQITVGAQ